MTLRDHQIEAVGRLSAKPLLRPTAARDAEYLLLHALGLPRTALFTEGSRAVSDGEAVRFRELVARRLAMEPVQYITGTQEFFGMAFRVTPAVLIPRPETELLVEALLARLPAGPVRIVDVGTGSGAIAVALAHSLAGARVVGLDLSDKALAVAEGNARRNGVAVEFSRSDLLAAVAGERFDAVVSNPPYVPEGERGTLHPQVAEHEPGLALFAGRDGLDVYRRLIPEAWEALEAGGLLALEIGWGQAEAVVGLLLGWQGLEVLDDLQGIARVVLARRG